MFHGLSAFPLTPLREGKFDEQAFVQLLRPLVDAGVDSLGILGSTGSYAYLTPEERTHITRCAVAHADNIPVSVSIGALRLDDILRLADEAQSAGARGVLLAPVSYQRLTAEEVFTLYETVTHRISVPLCIYDNPATTGFEFNDDLLYAVAALPNVKSVKLGRTPDNIATCVPVFLKTSPWASVATGGRRQPAGRVRCLVFGYRRALSADGTGDCTSQRHRSL